MHAKIILCLISNKNYTAKMEWNKKINGGMIEKMKNYTESGFAEIMTNISLCNNYQNINY